MPHKPLASSEKHYLKASGGLYGAALADLDDSVGGVLDALKQEGIDENSLVLLATTSHGSEAVVVVFVA